MSFGFSVGDVVLVQWRDGKIYFAKIRRIDEKRRQCAIMFDDNSRGDASFDQIHSVNETTTDWIVCIICKGGESDTPNEIVLCDKCGIGYHQRCHQPSIPSGALEPDAPWVCSYCLSGEVNPYWKPKDNPFQGGAGGRRSSAASYRLTKRRRLSQGGRTKSQSSAAEKDMVGGKPSFYRGRHTRDNTKLQLLEASRAPNFSDDVFSPADQGSNETTPSMEGDNEQGSSLATLAISQPQKEHSPIPEKKELEGEVKDGDELNGMPDLERFPTPEADVDVQEDEDPDNCQSSFAAPPEETIVASPPPPALMSPSPDSISREREQAAFSPSVGCSNDGDLEARGSIEFHETREQLPSSGEHRHRGHSVGLTDSEEKQISPREERHGITREESCSIDAEVSRPQEMQFPVSCSPSGQEFRQSVSSLASGRPVHFSPDQSIRNLEEVVTPQHGRVEVASRTSHDNRVETSVKTEKQWDSRYGTSTNSVTTRPSYAFSSAPPLPEERRLEKHDWPAIVLNPSINSSGHKLPVVSPVHQRRPDRSEGLSPSQHQSAASSSGANQPPEPVLSPSATGEGRGFVILAPSGRDLSTVSGQRAFTQTGPVHVSDAELRGSERRQRIVRPYSTVIPRTHNFNNSSGSSRRRYSVRRGFRSSRWSPPGRYVANRLGEPPQFVTDVKSSSGDLPPRRDPQMLPVHGMAMPPSDTKSVGLPSGHEAGNVPTLGLRGMSASHQVHSQHNNPTSAVPQEMHYGPVSGLIQKVPSESMGRPPPGASYAVSGQHDSVPGKVMYHPMSTGDQRYYAMGKIGATKRPYTAMTGHESGNPYPLDRQREGHHIHQSGYQPERVSQPTTHHPYQDLRTAQSVKRRMSITPASLTNSSLEQLVVIFNEEFERFVGSFGYRVRLRPYPEHYLPARQVTPVEDERLQRPGQPPVAPRSSRNLTVLHGERVPVQPVASGDQAVPLPYTSRATEAARAAALEVAAEAMRGRYRSSPEHDKGLTNLPANTPGDVPVVRLNGAGSGSARRREPSGHLCVACLRQAVFVCSKCQRTWYCSRECQLKVWKRYCANCN